MKENTALRDSLQELSLLKADSGENWVKYTLSEGWEDHLWQRGSLLMAWCWSKVLLYKAACVWLYWKMHSITGMPLCTISYFWEKEEHWGKDLLLLFICKELESSTSLYTLRRDREFMQPTPWVPLTRKPMTFIIFSKPWGCALLCSPSPAHVTVAGDVPCVMEIRGILPVPAGSYPKIQQAQQVTVLLPAQACKHLDFENIDQALCAHKAHGPDL